MNEFSQYIQIIGRGKKASKPLTQQQAYQAFKLLLANEATPEQVGAFLMLLRVKEESVEELAGFTQACREFNNTDLTCINADLDIGCYAGKRRHLPWFILAILCLAQQGYRFFLHGTQEPSSSRLYLSEAFQVLGLPMAISAQQAQSNIDNFGFAYLDLAYCNRNLNNLIQMRDMFGLRSPANTLARMLNPSSSNYSFHGVFHRDYEQKHSRVATLLTNEKIGCIRGEGGEVEVNPERPFDLYIQDKITTVINFPALLKYRQIKPAEFNLNELEQLWLGELKFEYAEQAIVGTIATLLALLTTVREPQHLIQDAKRLWRKRVNLPFSHLFQ